MLLLHYTNYHHTMDYIPLELWREYPLHLNFSQGYDFHYICISSFAYEIFEFLLELNLNLFLLIKKSVVCDPYEFQIPCPLDIYQIFHTPKLWQELPSLFEHICALFDSYTVKQNIQVFLTHPAFLVLT